MSSGFPAITALNLAQVSYPGIGQYESAEITDVTGVQPAVATIRVLAEYGLPSPNGDLSFYYQANAVTFKNCHIDDISFEEGTGGYVMNVRILDERWAWKFASITGKYNFRLPNNWVDPNHEMNPQDLAIMCFQALGVAVFDVSALPLDARPEVDWVSANPAEELDKICKDLGCIIVPIRSTGGWSIQFKGQGSNLPDGLPFNDWGQGVDPQETPDYIKIVTAPFRFQVQLPLGPVGKDLVAFLPGPTGTSNPQNIVWKPLGQLSYLPKPGLSPSYGLKPFGYFSDVSISRFLLADGTRVSYQELAQQSIFRSWRVEFAHESGSTRSVNFGNKKNPQYRWGMAIPGIPYPVCMEQIILTDELVDVWTDAFGQQHTRPAYIQGSFRGDLIESSATYGPNYPPGTRIDKQFKLSDIGMDERASFSLSFDPIDPTRSIIMTSKQMVKVTSVGETVDIPGEGPTPVPYDPDPNVDPSQNINTYVPAVLQYCCAIQVRDPNTWQPYRYEYLYQIGNGTNQNFCRVEAKEDIQPWVKGNYPDTTSSRGAHVNFKSYTNNQAEVDAQCLYYAQSLAREYTLVQSQTRTYFGIIPQDMNGLIQQITYQLGPQGSSTIMSAGTEHSYITPRADERRRQVARASLDGKLQYYRYEMQRLAALRGTKNT